MTICAFNSVCKTFGGTKLFNGLSFEVQEQDCIGLVGANGSGKSTILKLLARIELPDQGAVHIKKNATVGYLAQIPKVNPKWTCKDVLVSSFSELKRMEKRMNDLERMMADEGQEENVSKYIDEYGTIQDRFIEMGGYEIDSKINRVVNGLGIQSLLSLPFQQVSGGEQTKINLAYILLQNPNVLLLDEPTNHLDIRAVEWLEEYLKNYAGTIIIVSHDRYFLDAITKKIIDIEDGEATVYHKNYSGFVKEKEKNLLIEFQAYQEQQKKIKKMKEAIKRLREWANQSNPPSEGLHKRATNMQRALDRIEKKKKPVLERKKMNLQFAADERSGKEVVMLKDIAKIYNDDYLFYGIDLQLYYLERACIVGDNGTGKSTLLKVLLGQIEQDEGEVKIGSNVRIGYLSQHHVYENPKMTVLEAFRDEVSVTEGEARHILASFLFYGYAVFKRVGNLSGGERMRLRLAQLMHSNINFLVLDEPTNHLDIDSKEVLESALEDFEGTILAVSHDRYFLNRLFHKTYWLSNHTMQTFAGNYDFAKSKHNVEI